MDPRHRHLAEIALHAAGSQGFPQKLELAGALARPSGCRAGSSGFDRAMFAHALGAADQITDVAFTAYGVGASHIAAMRALFFRWREELLSC